MGLATPAHGSNEPMHQPQQLLLLGLVHRGAGKGWTRGNMAIPTSPTLRNTAASTTEPAVLHSTCASGSHACNGQQGNLLMKPIIRDSGYCYWCALISRC